MGLNDMKFGDVMKLLAALNKSGNAHETGPWQIGKCYLIRTCTMTLLGRLTAVWPQELQMSDASWIADTGRFHDAIADGPDELNEVEPMGHIVIGRGAVVDAVIWDHELPKEQK
jgi:hypothetical protein